MFKSFQQVEFTADDLHDLGEIGRGGFGTVNKMVHRKSNTIMAVKVRERKRILYRSTLLHPKSPKLKGSIN